MRQRENEWPTADGGGGGIGRDKLGLIRLRPAPGGLRRDKLGLIGFVFLCGAGRIFRIRLCGTGCCVGFVVQEIGFVLRKRPKATEVTENTEEWYIGEMHDRKPVYLWEAGRDRGFESAKIKMQKAKMRNPDVVGMGGLICFYGFHIDDPLLV